MLSTARIVVLLCLAAPLTAHPLLDDIWAPAICPPKCVCELRFHSGSGISQTRLKTVDCAHQELTEFPHLLPSDAQALLLTGNKISSLASVRLRFAPNLLVCDMSNNLIRTLGRHSAFEGAFNLRSLSLANNHLAHMANNVFQGLFNLEKLDLSRNRLSAIMDNAFSGLAKLETLRLTGNKITFIQSTWWVPLTDTLFELFLDHNYLSLLPQSSFSGLAHLISLDLAHNKLFRLNSRALAGLHRLEFLDLGSNQLPEVPSAALGPVRKTLKSINVGHNPVTNLGPRVFEGFPNLKDINLSHMKHLREIAASAFRDLPSMVIVEIHDNPGLAYVDPRAFLNCPSVTHLLLHNNNLTTLSQEGLPHLPALQTISFYGNPLVCDCNIKWLLKTVQSNQNIQAFQNSATPNLKFQDADRLVCDGPSNQRFKLLTALPLGEVSDNCAPRILPLLAPQTVVRFGQNVTLHCRVAGTPRPAIAWKLPNGNIYAAGQDDRLGEHDGGILQLNRVTSEHAGPYTCFAQNSFGSAVAHSTLYVAHLQVQLFPKAISEHSISLGWNGTDRDRYVFQILYRKLGENGESRGKFDGKHEYVGTVTPIMKVFTIQGLTSGTAYEACIASEDEKSVLVHISCIQFRTKSPDQAATTIYSQITPEHFVESSNQSIFHQPNVDKSLKPVAYWLSDASSVEHLVEERPRSNLALGIILSCIACLFIVLGLSLLVFTNRHRRRQRDSPYDNPRGPKRYFFANILPVTRDNARVSNSPSGLRDFDAMLTPSPSHGQIERVSLEGDAILHDNQTFGTASNWSFLDYSPDGPLVYLNQAGLVSSNPSPNQSQQSNFVPQAKENVYTPLVRYCSADTLRVSRNCEQFTNSVAPDNGYSVIPEPAYGRTS